MEIKDLRDAIYMKDDKGLVKFFNDHYAFSKGKNISHYKGNINKIYSLDDRDINYCIARMKHIEEQNDPSKFVPPMITFIIAIFSMYVTLLYKFKPLTYLTEDLDFAIYGILGLIGLFAYIGRKVTRILFYRGRAIFFRSILESVKLHEKNK